MLHRIPRVILLMLLRNEHLNMIGTLFSKKKNKDKEVELIGYERASRLVLWLLPSKKTSLYGYQLRCRRMHGRQAHILIFLLK